MSEGGNTYEFEFFGGPWAGMTVILFRCYEELKMEGGRYVWNLKRERFEWLRA